MHETFADFSSCDTCFFGSRTFRSTFPFLADEKGQPFLVHGDSLWESVWRLTREEVSDTSTGGWRLGCAG